MPIPTRENESTEETARGQVPAPASKIEVINKALKALYQKRPATYRDLANSAGLHPSITSLALSSARDVGLTRLAGKRGLYDFTTAGIDYARYLTQNRETECQAKLKEVLLASPLWADVIGF